MVGEVNRAGLVALSQVIHNQLMRIGQGVLYPGSKLSGIAHVAVGTHQGHHQAFAFDPALPYLLVKAVGSAMQMVCVVVNRNGVTLSIKFELSFGSAVGEAAWGGSKEGTVFDVGFVTIVQWVVESQGVFFYFPVFIGCLYAGDG